MRIWLSSLLLCCASFTASAECITHTAAMGASARNGGEVTRVAATTAPAREAVHQRTQHAGEIIKTSARQPGQRAQAEPRDEGGGRTAAAMLLAALAIMSAIALRHSGVFDQ